MTDEGDVMRLSAGKCYEIAGTVLRRLRVGPLGDEAAATWRARRADLQAEASVIAHVEHTWTADENALWNAMSRELRAVDETIARLAREAPAA
jgi:hypothetical protein